MADLPIIFSRPMVRALWDGYKTNTRRILKNVPPAPAIDNIGPNNTARHDAPYLDSYCSEPKTAANPRGMSDQWCWWTRDDRPGRQFKVRFVPGDRLWVREAFARIDNSEFNKPSCWEYRADTDGICFPGDWPAEEKDNPERPRWRPAIHMPREASRITLIVSAVKIERVQDISEEDARDEGISRLFTEEECRTAVGLVGTKPEDHGWKNYLWHGLVGREITGAQSDAWQHQFSGYRDARGSFSSLWASINGPDAWNDNPLVVATTFRVIKANIDAPEARDAA